jgi:hypothetical protein
MLMQSADYNYLWSQLQNVGGLKRLAGFCASQAGIFGNFRNF